MALSNVLQKFSKVNACNDELVQIEKEVRILYSNVKNGHYSIDEVKEQISNLTLKRAVVFQVLNKPEKIDKKDIIIDILEEIINIINKDGVKVRKEVIDIFLDFDLKYYNNLEKKTYSKEDIDQIIRSMEKVVELLDLKYVDMKFKENKVKYECKISSRQQLTFRTCLNFIAINKPMDAIHSLYEFIENYGLSNNEAFWMYEKVSMSVMIGGIIASLKKCKLNLR
ncbi:hypothetical protein BFS06_13685 [Clostridium perfringens]|uniref:Uncharacterized protein n=1 Tax=Clostridium perfringens TaxID=1502 RepID=A0A140GRT6_CLOPF|nr:hypothetical protein [Clostridium perfringens]AMN31245.1 hypothetical protein JFP838_pA0329 [Clostridium perfringens]TBX14257.1 hypothetical protein BFS06_13685 [Clostridium perfringens]